MKLIQNSFLVSLFGLFFLYGRTTPLSNNHFFPGLEKQTLSQTSIQRLRTNVYSINADSSKYLIDGTFNEFSDSYSNDLDGMDARKLSNSGFNISVLRGTTNLVIERRQTIQDSDTIPFRIWSAQRRSYLFEFVTNSFDAGLSCYLQDNYLNTETQIGFNYTTKIVFTINNDAGSSAPFRFRIIFKRKPFSFTFLKTEWQNNQVNVSWETENESGIKEYLIQRSSDGHYFSDQATITAGHSTLNRYQWLDQNSFSEINYYRVSSIGIDGLVKKKDELFASPVKSVQGISVFPNPASVTNLNLQMFNQQAGDYQLRLVNSYGQVLFQRSIKFSGINSIVNINPTVKIPKGIYHLMIKNPIGKMQIFNLVF